MVVLLAGLVAVVLAAALAYAGLRGAAPVGTLFWYVCFSLGFVQLAFLWNHVLAGAPDSGPSADGLFVTSLSLMATIATGVVTSPKPLPPERFMRSTLAASPRRLASLAVVVLAPAWLYFALLGTVPLFAALQAVATGGSSGLGVLQEARLARDPYVNSRAAYIPFQGLLELFRNVGTPVLFAAALHYFLLTRRRSYLVLMAICFVTVLGAGQRWPLQYLLFCSLFSLLLGTRRRSKKIWRIAAIGAGLGAVLTLLQGRSADESGATFAGGLSAIVNRLLLGYAELPIKSYSLGSPELHNQDGASYWQSIMAFLPGQSVSYPVTFYNLVEGIDGGYTASPDFATELHINWGIIGVIVGSAAWGLVLSWLDHTVLPRIETIEGLAVASGLMLCFAAAATEGAAGSVMRYVILAPLMFVGVRVISPLMGVGTRKDVVKHRASRARLTPAGKRAARRRPV